MSAQNNNDRSDRNDQDQTKLSDEAGRQIDAQYGTPGDKQAQSGLHTNFAHASPESNVNPAGHPQSSHGSIDGPVPGGVTSQIQASRESSGHGDIRAAQMGGNADAPAAGDMDDDGQSVVNSSGGADRENA
jgi:hypothetical protein